MIDCKTSVSAAFHACQILTWLPGGGGDNGGRGGISVGVGAGVPAPPTGTAVGRIVPLAGFVDVKDRAGVRLLWGVEVFDDRDEVAVLEAGVLVCCGPG